MPFRIQIGTPIPGVVWSPRSRAERETTRNELADLPPRQKSIAGAVMFLCILASLVGTVFLVGGAWGWLAVAGAAVWIAAIRASKRRQGFGFFEG